MPHTIPAPLQPEINSPVKTLATCVDLELTLGPNKGTVMRFTNHDRDLTFGGNVYSRDNAYTRTNLEVSDRLNVDNQDVIGVLDASGFDLTALRNGDLLGAKVTMFWVNWRSPDDGAAPFSIGFVGEVRHDTHNFVAELVSPMDKLQVPAGRLYQSACDVLLASTRCGVRVNPPEWTPATSMEVREVRDAITGSVVKPTTLNDRHFKCTTEGTTGEAEPSWNTTIGGTTTETIPATVWAGTTAYTVGDIVNPISPTGYVFVAQNSGTSSGSEPTWPTVVGATVADNDITWETLLSTPGVWTTIQALTVEGTVTTGASNRVFTDTGRA